KWKNGEKTGETAASETSLISAVRHKKLREPACTHVCVLVPLIDRGSSSKVIFPKVMTQPSTFDLKKVLKMYLSQPEDRKMGLNQL
ncbi:hypothetical protein AMECASPLE_021124, partial [Ameca splendens]